MKVNIFSHQKESTLNTPKHFRRHIFASVRFRILAWYFLLTTCTVLVSVGVTPQIFCNLLQKQAQDALAAEVDKFDRSIDSQVIKDRSQLSDIVKEVLPLHVTGENEYILALVAGQIINNRSSPLPKKIVQNLILEEWTKVTNLIRSELIVSKGPIYYAAKPIEINGTKGIVVAVRDARADYQTGTRTIILVIKVATIVLIIFSAIAWVTAGRVLFPIRQVTKTARMITQTDMSRRIVVTGNDEIAELSATFNTMLNRLSLAFETQQEFLKDAGHELRTPITVIQGHLEILKYRPEKQEETIALVTDELSRMSRLVNDLLLIAKAEQPRFLSIKLEELGLPGMDGMEVLRELRGRGETLPVIVLTARDGLDDVVSGLERGADDYITKPFRFEELLARVRVQLRKVRQPVAKAETKLQIGNLTLNLLTRQVWLGGKEIELSAREFILVETLIRHPMQVMSRQQLLDRIWGYDYDPGSNVVDVYIGHLRKKLGNNSIETVRGVGYRLRSDFQC